MTNTPSDNLDDAMAFFVTTCHGGSAMKRLYQAAYLIAELTELLIEQDVNRDEARKEALRLMGLHPEYVHEWFSRGGEQYP
jgi:hypothetical protein